MQVKRLCTICARAGSKGVHHKNIRELAGKPLLAYSILQAKACGLFKAVAVSSDSEEILHLAKKWGAQFLIKRPVHLATDAAPKLPVIEHALLSAEAASGHPFEVIVDLDVTSPLRYLSDIQAVVQLLETQRVSNVITGAPARRSPYFNLVELNGEGVVQLCKAAAEPVMRRQDAPECYDLNASVYAWQRAALVGQCTIFHHDTLLHVMPQERSFDIDSELDFQIVEILMTKRGRGYAADIL